MTGIQALEHKYSDKPPLPGQCAKMEFEYIRHGTTSLIGFFNIATGRVETPYLNQTRTEADLVAAVRTLVNTAPSASWTFVCDGLNTHKSESLVHFVAESCDLNVELGEKGKSGILKSMESRAEFLHDPSHRIRFVYTPKHSSWMNQIEIWFGIINKLLLKRKSYISVEELKQVFFASLNNTTLPLILSNGHTRAFPWQNNSSLFSQRYNSSRSYPVSRRRNRCE